MEHGRINPWGSRHKTGAAARPAAAESKMRAPAASEPAGIERRAETIARTESRQHAQHALHCLAVFAQNPIAVFAHDGKTMEHHGLARANNRTQATAIELLGQFQIDV